QVPDLPRRTRIVTIPNGVDVDRIPFCNRPPGKNLAFIADVRPVKNPMLMLQCLHRLHSMDPQYRMFWAGRCPDVALDQYIRHMTRALGLETAIQRDGWQDDINEWLKDKHYILCTSTIESQGMGVLEAMAAGLKPVVHNFPGAEETFGAEWLFDTPEQFCDQILAGAYEPQRYRRFVAERYSLADTLDRIESLLDGLAHGRPRAGGAGPGSANHQMRPATAEAPGF
ncbi:MAG TPA: glycosyltransferase family 1 protein, partial [Phycisphaerales bacterium]|nr:glycosyltransferase family 1 protein [Phycisphaerales bacterium]